MYGKIKKKIFIMEQPTVFEVEKYKELQGILQPVYSLTAGITNNFIIKTINF